jgi:hypothetical protein
MQSWTSYPKIYALGHSAVREILFDEVLVEEKVDGSQFSFGKFLDEEGKEYLRCRSKGAELNIYAPEKMFERAVTTARDLFPLLKLGWTYRGEYLASPRHVTLCYERVPVKHIILFDIATGLETYMGRQEKEAEAVRLGLEVVPVVHQGKVETVEFFRSLLDRTSILGKQKIEGVVVKNYRRFGLDAKPLLAKFVSEAFKEIHGSSWREANPTQGDVVQRLIEKLRTPARWAKAMQHLAEAGQLEYSPKDIGKLMKEIARDTQEECSEQIKQALFDWAWPQIHRGTMSGAPEWYKEQLLKRQFETQPQVQA